MHFYSDKTCRFRVLLTQSHQNSKRLGISYFSVKWKSIWMFSYDVQLSNFRSFCTNVAVIDDSYIHSSYINTPCMIDPYMIVMITLLALGC